MLTKDLLIAKTPLPAMTPAQERILDYLLSHPDNVAYMSSAQLALALGTSNATVVRFSQHIGFKGYLDLQRHIREAIKASLSVPQRLEKSVSRINGTGDFLKNVLKSDQDNLAHAAKTVPMDLFEQLVMAIHARKEIWVLGLRSCHGAAQFFATNLRFLSKRVNLISLEAGTVWEQIQPGLTPDALLIAMSFPRYCRQTVDITRHFQKAGALVAAITDAPASPLARESRITIPLPCWIDSFFESHVALMSFLNAVLAAVSYVDGPNTMSGLRNLEETWENEHVYTKTPTASRPSWADRFTRKQED